MSSSTTYQGWQGVGALPPVIRGVVRDDIDLRRNSVVFDHLPASLRQRKRPVRGGASCSEERPIVGKWVGGSRGVSPRSGAAGALDAVTREQIMGHSGAGSSTDVDYSVSFPPPGIRPGRGLIAVAM